MDEQLGQGVLYVPSIPDKRMTIGEVATRCWTESWKTIACVVSYRPTSCPPAYVSVFVDVEVDTWTGQVRTVKAAMGSDCGTVINPDMAAGQLEGGLSKGAGYALLEDNGWDERRPAPVEGLHGRREDPGVRGNAVHRRRSRPTSPTPTSRPARSARRASARRRPTPSRRPTPTRSTTPSACASTSCRSRPRRSSALRTRQRETRFLRETWFLRRGGALMTRRP